MRIFYKKTAIDDIQETERYIRQELHNKKTAHDLTRLIVKAISRLADQPYMGTPLNAKVDLETDLRFLTVSKRLIFYRVNGDHTEITRIIDGRRDYITHLFDGKL